jgi:parvulin-like peptidyl-prolyl isomerase
MLPPTPPAQFFRRVRLRALAAGIVLLAMAAACSLPDETAALVNGRPVSTAAFDEAYEAFLDTYNELLSPGTEAAAQAKKAVLDDLIDRELMRQEVEERGLMPSGARLEKELKSIRGDLDDDEFDTVLSGAGFTRETWRQKTAVDLAIAALQQEVVQKGVTVSEEEIDEYYRTHRGDFEVPEQVRASQILVRTREEAVAAARRIRAGEDFADVARDISLSPDAEKGGDLGYFARGEMPQEFDAVAFTLDVGTLSSVVETTYGFHLFLVTARRDSHRRNTEEARRHIRTLLTAKKSDDVFRTWLAGLRAGADIRYNKNIVTIQE